MANKMYYVSTPNKSFAGTRYGVKFYRGQAMGEFTEAQAKEMKNEGYEVGEVNGKLDKDAPAEQTPEKLEKKAEDAKEEKPEDKKEADVKKAPAKNKKK